MTLLVPWRHETAWHSTLCDTVQYKAFLCALLFDITSTPSPRNLDKDSLQGHMAQDSG